MGSKIYPSDFLLSGYYGFGNAGDEAILQGTVEALKARGAHVAVLSHTPLETASRLGVRAFGRGKLADILKGVGSSSVILSGGGGLFQDKTSFKSLLYYVRIPILARLMGKKTMVFAQGIGPINTPHGKKLTRWVCNRFVDRITVRDEESKTLLQSLGVTRNILVTADPAFLLDKPSEEEMRAVARRFRLDKEKHAYWGIVLREWDGMGSRVAAIGEGAARFSRASGAIPVLVSFQPGPDDTLLESVHRQLDVPHVVATGGLSTRELLSLVGSLDFLLGMRYHSLLFAATCGIPFAGIAYDPKVEHLVRTFGFPLLEPDKLSADRLDALLRDAWDVREKQKQTLKEQVPLLRKKAEINIQEALALLGKAKIPEPQGGKT